MKNALYISILALFPLAITFTGCSEKKAADASGTAVLHNVTTNENTQVALEYRVSAFAIGQPDDVSVTVTATGESFDFPGHVGKDGEYISTTLPYKGHANIDAEIGGRYFKVSGKTIVVTDDGNPQVALLVGSPSTQK